MERLKPCLGEWFLQVLSDECETVSDWRMHRGLSSKQLPPLGEGCGAVFFEVVSGVEVAFEIEVVMD